MSARVEFFSKTIADVFPHRQSANTYLNVTDQQTTETYVFIEFKFKLLIAEGKWIVACAHLSLLIPVEVHVFSVSHISTF